MKSHLDAARDVILRPGSVILAALALGYGIYARVLAVESRPLALPLGLWDVVLESAFSPQILTFVVIPAWLFYIVVHNRNSFAALRVVAWGGYYRALRGETLKSAKTYLIWAGTFVLIWAIASVGLPLEASPTAESVSSIFSQLSLPPAFAVICQVAFVGTVLLILQMAVGALRLLTQKKVWEIVFAICALSWVAFSTFDVIPSSSLLSASHVLDFAKAVADPITSAVAFVLLVATAAGLSLIVWTREPRSEARELLPLAVFPSIVAATLALAVLVTAPRGGSLFETLTSVYYGSGGTAVQLLSSVLLGLGFAYIFFLRMANLNRGMIGPMLIRYGSAGRLQWAEFSSQCLRAALFAASTAIFCGFLYFLAGGRELTPPPQGAAIWAYNLLINGTAQLVFYVAWTQSIAQWFRSKLAGAVGLGALLVVGAFAPGSWFQPVGAAGMSHVAEGWPAVISITILLCACTVILVVAQQVYLKVHIKSKAGIA
jgi:hypothetical protein